MRVESISFKGFPPLASGTLCFPTSSDTSVAEVQIITGQNGTGKTRILTAISAAFGNSTDLEARCKMSADCDIFISASLGSTPLFFSRSLGRGFQCKKESDRTELREQFLHDGLQFQLEVQTSSGTLYQFDSKDGPLEAVVKNSLLEFVNRTSSFSVQAYRGTSRISDQKIVAFQPMSSGDPRAHLTFERSESDDVLVCQTMANQKLSAALEIQDKLPAEQRRYTLIVESFENAVSQVTGRPFSFRPQLLPEPQLFVRWGDVVMKLQELPDGLRAIIGWLVSCISKLDVQFPQHPNPLQVPLILLLDEPETHLHPAWQRQIVPVAQKLFPNAQIFVATHSPFVISSVNSGWIHVLRPNETGIVVADEPKPCSKGDTWIDAVEDVLGLTSWYDPETETLLAEFRTLKREVLSERGDINSLKEKAEAIASRSESLRSMMAREMHQLGRNLAEAVPEP